MLVPRRFLIIFVRIIHFSFDFFSYIIHIDSVMTIYIKTKFNETNISSGEWGGFSVSILRNLILSRGVVILSTLIPWWLSTFRYLFYDTNIHLGEWDDFSVIILRNLIIFRGGVVCTRIVVNRIHHCACLYGNKFYSIIMNKSAWADIISPI